MSQLNVSDFYSECEDPFCSNKYENYSTEVPGKDLGMKSLSFGDMTLLALFSSIIAGTVGGNTLVILAVLTTRRLRTVTNCFVTSLAVADWLVGMFVMPPKVLLYLIDNKWRLGWFLCEVWISLDILLCTASILSLCAISVDRYLAITRPLAYSRRKRSKRLALSMISTVWAAAVIITSPPIFGWYDSNRNTEEKCEYSTNIGYVVYSALGSFFVPLLVMLYVYGRIAWVIAKRRRGGIKLQSTPSQRNPHHDSEDPSLTMTIEDTSRNIDSSERATRRIFPSCFNCWERGSAQETRKSNRDGEDVDGWPKVGLRLRPFPPIIDEGSRRDRLHLIGLRLCFYTNVPQSPELDRNKYVASPPQNSSETSEKASDKSCNKIWTVGSPMEEFEPANSNVRTVEEIPKNTRIYERRPIGLGNKAFSSSTRPMNSRSKNGRMRATSMESGLEDSTRISSFRRETKTAQTLATVVGGFIICWLPFFVTYVLSPFLTIEIPNELVEAFIWLGWSNSAINPFIYAFYSTDFRNAFWRLTFGKCDGCKKKLFQRNSRIHRSPKRFNGNSGRI